MGGGYGFSSQPDNHTIAGSNMTRLAKTQSLHASAPIEARYFLFCWVLAASSGEHEKEATENRRAANK